MKKPFFIISSMTMISAWLLCFTSVGLKIVLQLLITTLHHTAGVDVRYSEASGSIATGVHIHQSSVEHRLVELEMEDIDLKLRFSRLFLGQADIRQLRLGSVEVSLADQTKTTLKSQYEAVGLGRIPAVDKLFQELQQVPPLALHHVEYLHNRKGHLINMMLPGEKNTAVDLLIDNHGDIRGLLADQFSFYFKYTHEDDHDRWVSHDLFSHDLVVDKGEQWRVKLTPRDSGDEADHDNRLDLQATIGKHLALEAQGTVLGQALQWHVEGTLGQAPDLRSEVHYGDDALVLKWQQQLFLELDIQELKRYQKKVTGELQLKVRCNRQRHFNLHLQSRALHYDDIDVFELDTTFSGDEQSVQWVIEDGSVQYQDSLLNLYLQADMSAEKQHISMRTHGAVTASMTLSGAKSAQRWLWTIEDLTFDGHPLPVEEPWVMQWSSNHIVLDPWTLKTPYYQLAVAGRWSEQHGLDAVIRLMDIRLDLLPTHLFLPWVKNLAADCQLVLQVHYDPQGGLKIVNHAELDHTILEFNSPEGLIMHADKVDIQGTYGADATFNIRVEQGDDHIDILATKSTALKKSIWNVNLNTDHYPVAMFPYSDHMIAQGSLKIASEGNLFVLLGGIQLKDGTLDFTHGGHQVLKLPTEITFMDDDQQVVNTSQSIDFSIGVDDSVSIITHDISGKISGKILLKNSDDSSIIATGNINLVDGYLRVSENELPISHGTIYYLNDPLQDPHFNIMCKFYPQNDAFIDQNITMIGINVFGRTSDYSVKLLSEPNTLSRLEILSKLISQGHLPSGEASAHSPGLMRLLSKIRALIPISSISLVQFKNSEDPDDDMLNQSYLSLVRDLGNSMYFQYLMGLYRDDYKISLFYQISEQIKSEWYQEIFYGNTKSYGVNLLYKSS